jgi:FkbM family methyltransferase
MSITVFDVGANDGSSTKHLWSNPNINLYLFEPDPKLAEQLTASTANFPNVKFFQYAVSNVAGEAQFNLAFGSGCNSLNTFIDNIDQIAPRRIDIRPLGQSVMVKVVTLAQFIEENNIEKIDYLHCDVQGKDLEVLMGLGPHIDKVDRGVIEMPLNAKGRIYNEQVYDSADGVRFLHDNGFIVESMDVNDQFGLEVNLHYHKIQQSELDRHKYA